MKSSKDTIFYDFTTNLISQPDPYILRVLSGQRCLSDSVYMIPPEHLVRCHYRQRLSACLIRIRLYCGSGKDDEGWNKAIVHLSPPT